MASNICDDELRAKLLNVYDNVDSIPPITKETRSTLLRKVQSQSRHYKICQPSDQQIFDMPTQKMPLKLKTLVFFDLEATGLPCGTLPPRITELAFLALDVEHFLAEELKNTDDNLKKSHSGPRIKNILQLCFNPRSPIPDKVSQLTGLTNDLLENQPFFTSVTVSILNNFLQNLPQPICLVAHNGNKYDFPLLKAELVNVNSELTSNILTIDSLEALRHVFDNIYQEREIKEIENLVLNGFLDEDMDVDMSKTEAKKPFLRDEDELNVFKTPEKAVNVIPGKPPPTNHTLSRKQAAEQLSSERRKNGAKVRKKLNFDKPQSFSLPKLYQHIFQENPDQCHGAFDDCMNLIRVCTSKSRAFIDYAENNYAQFDDVKKMWCPNPEF